MKKLHSYLLTGTLVLLAAGLLLHRYYDLLVNPWTRNGQVAAQVIEIAPRVSGPIVALPIHDNQYVKKGDLLLQIDQSIFKEKLKSAQANLVNIRNQIQVLQKEVEIAQEQLKVATSQVNEAEAIVEKAQAMYNDSVLEFNRKKKLLKDQVISKKEYDSSQTNFEVNTARLKDFKTKLTQAKYKLNISKDNLEKATLARGKTDSNNAKLRLAESQLELAKLNLKYTDIKAPSDGYISNLQLREGDQMVQNKPALALIDTNSYWVYGFFQEDKIQNIQPGNKAIVTLMSYPDTSLQAEVESIGWGIAREDGSEGNNLLINIKASFEWIRLAQRIPVRIKLIDIPDKIKLRIGTTASVLVKTE